MLQSSTLTIRPARKFRGTVAVPGDKSISHRIALLGAMAEGDTVAHNFSAAADCASTVACLRALGVASFADGGALVVRGRGVSALRPAAGVLDAGNSGSTARMLAGVLAGRPFEATISGDDSLRRRPFERVAVPLRAMGASLATTDGRLPLRIRGGPLRGIDWELEVASAQVKTAILLAGLQAEGETSVREPHASRDHSERLLPAFGAVLRREGRRVTVRGGTPLTGVELHVPGDASSAAFFVVAALVVPDAEVRIENVSLNPGRVAFLEVLRAMGGRIEVEPTRSAPEPAGTIVARSSELRGVEVPPELVPGLIDEVPALAVAATQASGSFVVRGATELRVKESDRIATLAEGLRRLGAALEERPDGLTVRGGFRLSGAAVRSHGDHRIAMALAVAALVADGETTIEGSECVAVSFPDFFTRLEQAAGRDA